MSIVHHALASGRWHTFTLNQQLAHIGSEVMRMLNWKKRGDAESFRQAALRALELLDLTTEDPRIQRNPRRLSELARLREVLADVMEGGVSYGVSGEMLEGYFLPFALAARK